MALTYKDIWGCTLQSFNDLSDAGINITESASTISTSPLPYTGAEAAYEIDGTDDLTFGTADTATDIRVYGFWVRFPTSEGTVIGYPFFADTSGRVGLTRAASNTLTVSVWTSTGYDRFTGVASLSTGVWYFIEIISGYLFGTEILVNGSLVFDGSSPSNSPNWNYLLTLSPYLSPVQFQAGYIANGVTTGSDALVYTRHNKGIQVFGYRSAITSATPDVGDALNTGSWDDAENVPTAIETTYCAYTDAAAQYGLIKCDGEGGSETTGGLAVDSNVVGSIVAAGVVAVASRGGGGDTAQYLRVGNGNTTDVLSGLTQSADLNLTVDKTVYKHFITDTDSNCPSAGEDLWIGIEKSSGGQDYEVWALGGFVLHTQPEAFKSLNEITRSNIASINEVSLTNIASMNEVDVNS